ncbi:B12-binding domain-containing radical SAM protein [Thiosocius teredinicola]|uniref:B12-binding domain-containing radical SAM protein n=1 Tax=Thiosocius teredinicola TaxID=1973002 RepID=UPI002FE4AC61
MEPLQIGVLAALTPPHHSVCFFDDRMESIAFDEPTDLVAITVETYTAKRAYEIASEYRRRGVPVIMGGVHPTLVPDECLEHADAILLGDAETIWQSMLEDAEQHQLKRVYRASPGVAHPGVLPRRDLFAGKGYLPMTLMQFSRGCHFHCNFCTIAQYFNSRHYVRHVDEVVREIADQNRRLVFFVDDNLCANRKAAKELFKALIPLKIRWVSQSSLDMLRDAELMDLMIQSGCLGHVIGFESITPDNLSDMHKGHNLRAFDGYRSQVKILRDYGLQTWAAFVLGYDHETRDSIRRTLDFALESRFTFAAFNMLTPYPGTPLYDSLRDQNRLLYDGKWWLHPAYRFNYAPFVPARMTPDELTEACFEARSTFSSLPSLVHRMLDFKTNLRDPVRLFTYLRFNPVFRKEVFKKQGMYFGQWSELSDGWQRS